MAKLLLDEFERSDLEFKLSSKKLSLDSINIFNMSVEYNYYFKYEFVDNKTETIRDFIKWLELAVNDETNKSLGMFKDYSGNFMALTDEYGDIIFEFVLLRDGDKIISTYEIEGVEEKNLIPFINELKEEYNLKFEKGKYKSKKPY